MSTICSRIAPLLPALLALGAAGCAAGGRSGAPPGAAAAPVLSPAAAAPIEWRRPAAQPGTVLRQQVTIDLGGLWVGPDDPRAGPRVHYLFARRRRSEDLAQFVRDYAPFQASDLVFRGRGAAQASAAERRMIGEWTRAVAAEAAGDAGSLSPYGLAFAWHRGAASGGACDDLVVHLTGEVRSGSCGAGVEAVGRLSGERLQRLYAWVDGLAAFQDAGEQELRAGALLDRLVFAGRGRQRASAGEIAAIEAFAGVLHRELTAAAPAPAVEGPATPRIAAAVPKAALPPRREAAPDAAVAAGAETAADAAADAEQNAASPPAQAVQAPRPPRRREAAVPDEPDEAPPPSTEEHSPPPQPPQRPRKQPANAPPPPRAPVPQAPPPLSPPPPPPAIPARPA